MTSIASLWVVERNFQKSANPPSKTAVSLGCMKLSLLRRFAGSNGTVLPIGPVFGAVWLLLAGISSAAIPPQGDWVAVTCSSDGTRLAAASLSLRGEEDGRAIFLSPDGGTTWERSSAPKLSWTSLASSSNGQWLAAGGSGEGIYISSDVGKTWRKTSAPNAYWTSIAMSADGSKLLAACRSSWDWEPWPAPGGFYLSSDSGLTWVKAELTASRPFSPFVASSSDGARLVAASSGLIFLSSDAGLTWRKSSAPESAWSSLACSADGKRIIAASDEGVHISMDEGASWLRSALPGQRWWSVASSADGMNLLASQRSSRSSGSSIHRSFDGGLTWTEDTDWSPFVDGVDGDIVLACSADGSRAVVGIGNHELGGVGGWFIADYGGVYIRSLTLPPALSVQRAGGELILSWPEAAAGFHLESASGPDGPWTTVSATPAAEGSRLTLRVLMDQTAGIYRLHRP